MPTPELLRKLNPARFGGMSLKMAAIVGVREFGKASWELDALSPRVIADLIRNAIMQLMDMDAWEKAVKREDRSRTLLTTAARDWNKVEKFLEGTK